MVSGATISFLTGTVSFRILGSDVLFHSALLCFAFRPIQVHFMQEISDEKLTVRCNHKHSVSTDILPYKKLLLRTELGGLVRK